MIGAGFPVCVTDDVDGARAAAARDVRDLRHAAVVPGDARPRGCGRARRHRDRRRRGGGARPDRRARRDRRHRPHRQRLRLHATSATAPTPSSHPPLTPSCRDARMEQASSDGPRRARWKSYSASRRCLARALGPARDLAADERHLHVELAVRRCGGCRRRRWARGASCPGTFTGAPFTSMVNVAVAGAVECRARPSGRPAPSCWWA